ncbi:relaxase domain-containing protein [Streptomyces puniciscabiei]
MVLYENAVAASGLYNEVVMAEVCEALGLASEPRTVTAGRRPVMDVAGVPHELIRWTSRRRRGVPTQVRAPGQPVTSRLTRSFRGTPTVRGSWTIAASATCGASFTA